MVPLFTTPSGYHLWHDLSPGDEAPDIVRAVILKILIAA
jgi:hypothetical protein